MLNCFDLFDVLINNKTNVLFLSDPSEGPSVDHALSMSPTQAAAHAEPRKTLIGAKKTGGAKKSVS